MGIFLINNNAVINKCFVIHYLGKEGTLQCTVLSIMQQLNAKQKVLPTDLSKKWIDIFISLYHKKPGDFYSSNKKIVLHQIPKSILSQHKLILQPQYDVKSAFKTKITIHKIIKTQTFQHRIYLLELFENRKLNSKKCVTCTLFSLKRMIVWHIRMVSQLNSHWN